MTSTPHDPAHKSAHESAHESGAGHHAAEVVELGGSPDVVPASPGRRRGLVAGGGLLAVLLVGGGVTYAVGAVGGGGAAPEQAIPSTAFAVVKVDLDPSAAQKVGALRFARKFPDAKSQLGSSDDPRQALFEALSKDGTLQGSWKTDVEPWLGKRGALAVVPGATAEADPVPVVVLSVTDAAKARAGLTKVTGGKAQCSVDDDFAVCAETEAVAKAAVSAADRSSISDNKTFGSDVEALGGEGIATAWVDLSKARSAVPALESALRSSGAAGAGMTSGLQLAQLKGRYVTSLRFDGDDLELVGRIEGTDLPAITGTSGVGELPAGTLAAAGTAGADQLIATSWTQLRTTLAAAGGADQVDQQVKAIEQQYGIAIPGDIQAALGERTAIAYTGTKDGVPQVALRVSGDSSSVAKLVSAATTAGGGSLKLGTAKAGSDTVVALDQASADSFASGSGLGDDATFKAAVPGATDAQQVIYVNIAKLVDDLGEQGSDVTGGNANVKPLSAFGMSAGRDGSASTFTLRLTTR